MGRALLYYELLSRWNRLRSRLQRLRQPKYLFGAVVGGLYFYWYFFRVLMRRPAAAGAPATGWLTGHHALVESLAGLVLLVIVLLMWIIPHERAALMFTEAEVAFLFPAPVGRRTLLHFKLLKSQGAILFSALFMTLIGRWSGGNSLIRAAGWWGLLSLVNLHLLGSSFARTMLLERGISNWRRRLFVLGGAALAAAGVILWARQALPAWPDLSNPGAQAVPALTDYAGLLFQSGPLPWFWRRFAGGGSAAGSQHRTILSSPSARCWACSRCITGGSCGPMWPLKRPQSSCHANSADRIAAMRAGNWQAMSKPAKAKRPPFELRAGGLAGGGHFLEKPHQRRPFLHRPRLVLSDLDCGACGRIAAPAMPAIPAAAWPWGFWLLRSA